MAPWSPYVPSSQSPAEFTAKAIVLGILFGLLFGASTVYLGLRAGLTVSASIPIAVLAISVLKKFGGSTILENNIVQTIGSAGESVAGGVVFTIPALIFLVPFGPAYFNYLQITMLTLAGGVLGVLMMVPLRRARIVDEHATLPYPEGTACAEVLVAGERGGRLAALVFGGLGIGALWKALSWIFNLFRTEIGYAMPRASQFPNATLAVDISPEYLGVGYVIGPRIAGTMVAGGVLAWLGLLPLLSILGGFMTEPFPPIHPNFAMNPATGRPFLISEMDANQLWSAYIRYIGAGGVLAAGIITLARTLPTIVSSARGGLRGFTAAVGGAGRARTERDIPMRVVLGGCLLLAIFLAAAPGLPTQGNLVAAALILVFGFFFATVSSRITGLIGSSSNPISGMTIATLILTCVLFVALVLGPIAWWNRVSLLQLMRYIKTELLIVVGTSSGESVFPRLNAKLRTLGCEESIVALVLPAGYAFNHDGTCLYFAAVSVFLAQAVGIDLSVSQQVGLLAIMLFTSKGGGGVAGSAIVVLASTLSATGTIPVASIGIILGVHRFLSSAFVPVNVLGNALATIVIARMEGAVDIDTLNTELSRSPAS